MAARTRGNALVATSGFVALSAIALAACEAPPAADPAASAAPVVAPAPEPMLVTSTPMQPAPDDAIGAEVAEVAEVAEGAEGAETALDGDRDPAAARRAAWLADGFRCRAISTTRFRRCRFVADESGEDVSITFPVADVRCERVLFDASGDPARLEQCRSSWLRVPATIELAPSGDGTVWSGARSGWRWTDGDPYCCPGVWIAAPESVREGWEPLDADRDRPPPKPPRD